MKRVMVYIDGYNLYYGIRSKGWRRYYWLNLRALSLSLLKKDQVLMKVKYFTTVVKQPKGRHDRQALFLEALGTLSDLEIHFGHFLSEEIKCRNCGHTYETHHEKMTDVNISVQLLTDAFRDRFDVAILISADSDLVDTITSIRQLFPQKSIVVAFPPNRVSKALKQVANATIHVSRNSLAQSQFPDKLTKPNGYVLQRPASWR